MNKLQDLSFVINRAFFLPKNDAVVEIDEDSLALALTVQKNIEELGYTLTPRAIITLASSQAFQSHELCIDCWLKDLLYDIPTKPMYPNFPSQVLELDESTKRIHQLCHYASFIDNLLAYGNENVKAWVPDVEDTIKTKEDTPLLDNKILDIISYKDVVKRAETLIEKRERWTKNEALYVFKLLELGDLNATQYKVGFKENINSLAYFTAVINPNKILLKQILTKFCQNPNDVLDIIEECLKPYQKYSEIQSFLSNLFEIHFTPTNTKKLLPTSIKKVFVKVLEGFNVNSFKENLVANGNKERNKVLLKSISYNRFSRSEDHLKAVTQLRNNQLVSWNSRLEKHYQNLIKNPNNENKRALIAFITTRPGVFIRNIVRLYRVGLSYEELIGCLTDVQVQTLSLQTLISTLNYLTQDFTKNPRLILNNRSELERKNEISLVTCVFYDLIKRRLSFVNTPLKGKNVYIDEKQYDLAHSYISTNDKGAHGGYIRSGLAIKLPEDIKRVRFFTYWNDKRCIDIDLHGYSVDANGFTEHMAYTASNYVNEHGVSYSGDIRNSDSAEYIDVDLSVAEKANVQNVYLNINLFSGAPSFKDVETCFTGLMAVNKTDKKVKLYNNKNVFFRHDLLNSTRDLNYGLINIPHKYLLLQSDNGFDNPKFNVMKYLEILFEMQDVHVVDNKDEADIIMVVDKPENSKEMSLLDNDFFLSEEFS